MAWTTPTTRATGYFVTASVWNADIVDNLIALRAGAVALTSQAQYDLMYASSSTQWARIANGTTGQVFVATTAGVPSWSSSLLLTAATATFTGNLVIPALKKFYIDGGGDTYWVETTGNQLDQFVGAANIGRFTATANISLVDFQLSATKKLYLDSGGDTYLVESAANQVDHYAGGAFWRQTDTKADFNALDVMVGSTKKLYLDGGGDTYLFETSANRVRLMVGGLLAADWLVTAGAQADVTFPGVYNTTSNSGPDVVVDSNGRVLRSTSSLRYKNDVQSFNGGLTELLKLQPVSFVSKNETEGPRYIGFTAEALDDAGFYNVVKYDDQGRPDAIQYDRLTTYLVNAVKELSEEVDALKAAQGKAVTHAAAAVDAASRTKAIAKEQAAKAVRDQSVSLR